MTCASNVRSEGEKGKPWSATVVQKAKLRTFIVAFRPIILNVFAASFSPSVPCAALVQLPARFNKDVGTQLCGYQVGILLFNPVTRLARVQTDPWPARELQSRAGSRVSSRVGTPCLSLEAAHSLCAGTMLSWHPWRCSLSPNQPWRRAVIAISSSENVSLTAL
jgi:hypothetical protein